MDALAIDGAWWMAPSALKLLVHQVVCTVLCRNAKSPSRGVQWPVQSAGKKLSSSILAKLLSVRVRLSNERAEKPALLLQQMAKKGRRKKKTVEWMTKFVGIAALGCLEDANSSFSWLLVERWVTGWGHTDMYSDVREFKFLQRRSGAYSFLQLSRYSYTAGDERISKHSNSICST